MIFTILIYSPWNAYTGYTTARYVNKNKYKSRYDILNHVVIEYWVYVEFGEGFGMPKNAFFTTDKTDDIRRLHHAGRSENIKWGRSDLKLGKFKFSDFLDCTDISNTTDLQFRLSERICLQQHVRPRYWFYTAPCNPRYWLRDTRYIPSAG